MQLRDSNTHEHLATVPRILLVLHISTVYYTLICHAYNSPFPLAGVAGKIEKVRSTHCLVYGVVYMCVCACVLNSEQHRNMHLYLVHRTKVSLIVEHACYILFAFVRMMA